MAQLNDVKKQALPRSFKVLLGVSLALNLAVVGIIAGSVLRKGPEGPNRSSGGNASFARPYMKALPEEDRRAIFDATRTTYKRADREQRRAQYLAVTEILRAENFDRVAVETVLAAQTASSLGLQNAGQTQWLNAVEKMDVQERRSYADAIEDILKRGKKGKRKPKSE